MDINKHKSLLHSLFSAKRSVLMDKGWFSGLPTIKMIGRFTVARLRRISTGLALFEHLYVFSRRCYLCRGATIQFWFGCGTNVPNSSIISPATRGMQGMVPTRILDEAAYYRALVSTILTKGYKVLYQEH